MGGFFDRIQTVARFLLSAISSSELCALVVVHCRGDVQVEKEHNEDVTLIIKELAAAGEAELGIKLDEGCVERLNAYARAVAHFPTAVKEFEWRNGWFYGISTRAVEAGAADPCPMHTAWLKEVGAV